MHNKGLDLNPDQHLDFNGHGSQTNHQEEQRPNWNSGHAENSEVEDNQAELSDFSAYGGDIQGGLFDAAAYVMAQRENADEAGRDTGKPQNAQEGGVFDLELEKDFIVLRMLGQKASIDPPLADNLSFVTDVYSSFDSGIPRHCALECSNTNDPGSCCWKVKSAQFQENRQIFRRDITVLVNSFLEREGKRLVRIPEYCEHFFEAWFRDNKKDPYMKRTEIEETAKMLGLTFKQVDMQLKNYRTKKWAGAEQAGSSQRKGKYFHHATDATQRLKDWLQSHNFRHPNLEERKALSKETQMTPAEILTWCYNYKGKHKDEVKQMTQLPTSRKDVEKQ